MEGLGVYTWQDGRKYEGEYLYDKKHGYGVYIWSDGRVFKGNWLGGKQHGLGMYTVPGEEVRFGLWEEGKRIEWFDKAQVYQIETGRLDYRKFFRKIENAQEAPMIVLGQLSKPMGEQEYG